MNIETVPTTNQDVVSKMQQQNANLVSEIVDKSRDKIQVGEPGETPEQRALKLSPEAQRFVAQREALKGQVGKRYDQLANQALAQNQGVEISEAVVGAEKKQSQRKDMYQKEVEGYKKVYGAKNKSDEAGYSKAKEIVSVAKQEVRQGIAEGSELSGLKQDIAKREVTSKSLEILKDPELSNAILDSIGVLEQAESKLSDEIREKESKLRKIGVQKTLVKSYGKVLSALQGVRVFGIDKAARRAAIKVSLPGEKNDGSEYWAKQEVQKGKESVEENLLGAKASVEEAIIRNESAIEEAERQVESNKGKSSLINLIVSRAGNLKARFNSIRGSRRGLREGLEEERAKLNEKVMEISSKDMNAYTGMDMDYDKFLQATKDSVVAVQSQDNIAHRQDLIRSNEANLKGLTSKTIAERSEEGDAGNEINKALEKINQNRANRGVAPMTPEERNYQTDRLLGKETL